MILTLKLKKNIVLAFLLFICIKPIFFSFHGVNTTLHSLVALVCGQVYEGSNRVLMLVVYVYHLESTQRLSLVALEYVDRCTQVALKLSCRSHVQDFTLLVGNQINTKSLPINGLRKTQNSVVEVFVSTCQSSMWLTLVFICLFG